MEYNTFTDKVFRAVTRQFQSKDFIVPKMNLKISLPWYEGYENFFVLPFDENKEVNNLSYFEMIPD